MFIFRGIELLEGSIHHVGTSLLHQFAASLSLQWMAIAGAVRWWQCTASGKYWERRWA